jgi:hypothetical protein
MKNERGALLFKQPAWNLRQRSLSLVSFSPPANALHSSFFILNYFPSRICQKIPAVDSCGGTGTTAGLVFGSRVNNGLSLWRYFLSGI